MLNYFKGELYRLTHKKSFYIYFLSIAVFYGILTLIRRDGLGPKSLMMDANSLFDFLPAIVGGFLLAAIYTDDLNSKTLTTLVGFGMGKGKIVAVKAILAVLTSAIVLGATPLIMDGIYSILGISVPWDIVSQVYITALKTFLLTIGFMLVSAIVVYGKQRSAMAMVAQIFLGLGVVDTLCTLLFKMNFLQKLVPHATDQLLSNIGSTIALDVTEGTIAAAPIIKYAIYIVAALLLSTFVFRKKEMEF